MELSAGRVLESFDRILGGASQSPQLLENRRGHRLPSFQAVDPAARDPLVRDRVHGIGSELIQGLTKLSTPSADQVGEIRALFSATTLVVLGRHGAHPATPGR